MSCHSLGTIHLVFEDRVSHWSGTPEAQWIHLPAPSQGQDYKQHISLSFLCGFQELKAGSPACITNTLMTKFSLYHLQGFVCVCVCQQYPIPCFCLQIQIYRQIPHIKMARLTVPFPLSSPRWRQQVRKSGKNRTGNLSLAFKS